MNSSTLILPWFTFVARHFVHIMRSRINLVDTISLRIDIIFNKLLSMLFSRRAGLTVSESLASPQI